VKLKISILNYGVGNLYSITVALLREGAMPRITKDVKRVRDSDAILLPGVGSFTQATKMLPTEEIRDVVGSGKPVLGICLGLQLFFRGSEEGPGEGLDLLPGRVKKLPDTVKVPQIGWNTIEIRNSGQLMDGIPDESWVYYVHSYYPSTRGRWVAATSRYGVEYPCIVASKNLFGTQFHPEKSGKTGRRILRNFLKAARR
jgi:glutamine amidotransferase